MKEDIIFITGTGTAIGKTLASAILVQALGCSYWKPVQAGMEEGTDAETVRQLVSDSSARIEDESYILRLPASPHYAARQEGVRISLDRLEDDAKNIVSKMKKGPLLIEGAGGLMVPLNEKAFVIDLIERLNARVLLVSRNYLGSINHSLLTARVLAERKISVIGWIFNDSYIDYSDEIAAWTGLPVIMRIPHTDFADRHFVQEQADAHRKILSTYLC